MNARMTRVQALDRLLDGIRDDIAAGAAVRILLERQFDAALRRAGVDLAALSEQLTPQLAAMEARRGQRVQLVRALFGPEATMAALFAALDAQRRDAAAAAWRELEQLVRDCQQAARRNGSLMADQHAIMQRLLHGEEATYAPR